MSAEIKGTKIHEGIFYPSDAIVSQTDNDFKLKTGLSGHGRYQQPANAYLNGV